MDNGLVGRYSELSIEDLRRIAGASDADYRPDAIEAARRELARRGEPAAADNAIPKQSEEVESAEGEHREAVCKVLGLIFPFIGVLVSLYFFATGRRRIARTGILWVGYGVLLYLLLSLVSQLVKS